MLTCRQCRNDQLPMLEDEDSESDGAASGECVPADAGHRTLSVEIAIFVALKKCVASAEVVFVEALGEEVGILRSGRGPLTLYSQ